MDIFSQNELLREIYNFDRRSDEKKDSRESLNLNKNVNEGNIITKKEEHLKWKKFMPFINFKRKSLLAMEVKNRFPENNYFVKDKKKL